MEARLVCFETSGAFGGIAFLLGKKTWEIKFSADKSYSSHLFRFLPLIFQSNQSERALPTLFPLEEADYFVVDVGPGSFTGLRVGLSLVKALTLVNEKPVIPISSLEVLSFGYGCPDLPILSLIDAYTGEVFVGMYRWEKGRLTTLLEPCLLRLEELESLIQEKTLIVSETVEKWKDYLSERLSHKVVFPSNPIELSASLLGRFAMLKLSQGEAKVLSGDEVLPLYLKPSQAERKRS
ncbi:MAG: tRNA (adenosine(37)-N6)-threonylcarbamoyltransferase complex dimerization subunit type 1 TsaB [Caldimicrobium sp.]|jgi:tRNA threonylcarbamoyladenosine biosynthesis protein TsaB|nr:tRNA (adenosine(37)-N6)-threonylcarbamoyltransferase complex dimerization subunit type 1 TsaB [Caldimicrobium sp.]